MSRDPVCVNKQALCSLCRQPFTADYLESNKVLQEAVATLNSTPPLGPDPTLNDDDRWQWFYQGNKGWWRFERRNNEDLEQSPECTSYHRSAFVHFDLLADNF